MTYLQLRITCDPSGSTTVTAHATYRLLKLFIRQWLVPQDASHCTTVGREELNKYGEPCDEHFHLNSYFDPSDLKDPLRSAKNWLKRKALEAGFSLKGNKRWSCTLVEEPQDYERWLRYPLKENPLFDVCTVPPQTDLSQLARDAKNERKRGIELNIIKREKAMDKQSFKDKLFKYLDAKNEESYHNDEDEFTHKTIWLLILKYYQEQGKAVCFKTVTGYTVLYMLYLGLLTPEQCYEMRSNPQ